MTPRCTLTPSDLLAFTRLPWPLPAGGRTGERWSRIASLAQDDLPLAKLVEPHHDAAAILADLGGPAVGSEEIWAVWAAEPPFARLEARRTDGGWVVAGRKAFCSGATLVTHALVTAAAPDGPRLFAIDLSDPGIGVDGLDHPWVGTGMARAQTSTMTFADVLATPVGGPEDYTSRPGFWWGAIGIAAAWLGGARGVATQLELASDRLDPHGLAHLGAVRADLDTMELTLQAAAARADEDELTSPQVERLAQAIRARSAKLAADVVAHTAEALGPGPLAFDADHSARVCDLNLFVRQHHGARDLARLGSLGSTRV